MPWSLFSKKSLGWAEGLTPQERSRWLVVLPLTALIAAIATFAAHRLIVLRPDGCSDAFVSFVNKWCTDNRPQKLSFLVGLSGFAIATWIGLIARTPVMLLPIRALQALTLIWIAFQAIAQNLTDHSYISQWHFARAAIFACLIFFLSDRLRVLSQKIDRLPAWVGWAAWMVLLCLYLSPMIFTETSRPGSLGLAYNIPYGQAEFAAVANGATPRVDFFPQYMALINWLAIPVSSVWGSGLGPFMGTLAAVTGLAWLAVFGTLRLCAGSLGFGFGAFALSLCALAGIAIPEQDWYGHIINPFTNPAGFPIRLVLPLIAMFVLALGHARESKKLQNMAVLTATMAAINNMDFGLPALLSVCLGNAWHRKDRGLRPLVSDAAIVLGTLLAYSLMCWLRAGDFPQWRHVFQFQSAFAADNFFGMVIKPHGYYWLMLFTWGAAVQFGLKRDPSSAASRALQVSLMQLGVFSLLSMMYYVHRPHWEVLQLYFAQWILAIGLLFLAVRRSVFKLLLLIALCSAGLLVTRAPNIKVQIERINSVSPEKPPTQDEIARAISHDVQPGQKTMMIHPLGFEIMNRAGLRNYSPFAQHESILLMSQVELCLQIIEREKIDWVMGFPWSELIRELKARGFESKDQSETRKLGFESYFKPRQSLP